MREASHIFSTKNIGIYQIIMFEILTKTLTNDVVSFEQPGPGLHLKNHITPKVLKKQLFFSLRVHPTEKGGKCKMAQLLPLKSQSLLTHSFTYT